MGTRPKTENQRPIGLGGRSKMARARIAGPSVINRNSSDGGYFSQFRNEKKVNKAFFWGVQGRGSPYRLRPRRATNTATMRSARPRNHRRRRGASSLTIGPNAYPAAKTATQGISGYMTQKWNPSTGS